MVGDNIKLKVLFCHFGVLKKGGWGRTFSLAEGLVEQGHKVTLLTTNEKISLRILKKEMNGVKVLVFPEIFPLALSSKGFGVLSLFLKLIYVLFNRFQIVQSDSGHRPSAGFPCILNKKIYGSRYVAEWWDFFGKGGQLDNKAKMFRIFLGWFESWSEIHDKRVADRIVVLSEFMKKRAILKGIDKSKINVIHGGADVKKIRELKWNIEKSKLGINNNIIVFGYIGMSESEIKDLEPFLIALSNYRGKVKFATFGQKISNASIQKYGLEDIIIQRGWVDYADDYEKLGIVDVFVLIKKDNEINTAGWPNKLGDYLACGRPVMVTPYGDIDSFIKAYVEAFIPVSYKSESIKKDINKLINGGYRLHRMGKYARMVAEREISWKMKSSQLISLYQTC